MGNEQEVYFAYCGFCLRTLKSADAKETERGTKVNFSCRCGKEFTLTIRPKNFKKSK